jgi:hypothetical protein
MLHTRHLCARGCSGERRTAFSYFLCLNHDNPYSSSKLLLWSDRMRCRTYHPFWSLARAYAGHVQSVASKLEHRRSDRLQSLVPMFLYTQAIWSRSRSYSSKQLARHNLTGTCVMTVLTFTDSLDSWHKWPPFRIGHLHQMLLCLLSHYRPSFATRYTALCSPHPALS